LLAEAILFAFENPCNDPAASSVRAPPILAVTEPTGDHHVRPTPERSSRRLISSDKGHFAPRRRRFHSSCAIADNGLTVGRAPTAQSLRASKDQACVA
jgi:hypothetical protein